MLLEDFLDRVEGVVLTLDRLADLLDLGRLDGREVVAEGLADVGDHRGDVLVVEELAEAGHHGLAGGGVAVGLTVDGLDAVEAVENDLDDAVRVAFEPAVGRIARRATEGRVGAAGGLAGFLGHLGAAAVGLVAGRAVGFAEVDFLALVVELLVGGRELFVARSVGGFLGVGVVAEVHLALALGEGLELLHRLTEAVGDGRVLGALEGRGGGDGALGVLAAEETEAADAFELDAQVGVLDGGFHDREGVREAVALVDGDAHGLGTGARLGGFQQLAEKLRVHDVVPLVDPEGFEQVVGVLDLGRVELLGPLLDGGDHLRGVVLVQLDLGALADVVFVLGQERDEVLDGLAVDLLRREERAAGVGQAVEAAVLVVAVRVTQMVLEVADEHLRPVHDVERAIGGDGDAGGAEVAGLLLVGLDEVRQEGLALQAGAVLGDLRAEDALDGDHVRVEEVALPVVGEVTAAEDRGARAGAGRAIPELRVLGMGAFVQMTGEARAEVVGVAGGVGDDVVAPVVEDAAVRVGEAVGHVAGQLVGLGFEAVDGTVGVAQHAVEGLDLGAVEHAVGEVDGASRFIADGVRLVVRVGGVHAGEQAFLPVGLAVAVGVADVPDVGRLDEDDAVLVELEAGRAVEAVEEGRGLEDLAGLRVEIQDDELVEDLGGRGGLGVGRPAGDPEAALGVEVHLHRVDQLGDDRLVGDELDLHAFGGGEVLELVDAAEVGDRFLAVRGNGDLGLEVVVLHFDRLALGGGPDALVVVGGLEVAVGEFGAEHRGVVDAFVFDAGALAEDVELVDRAVAVVPLGALFVHLGADLLVESHFIAAVQEEEDAESEDGDADQLHRVLAVFFGGLEEGGQHQDRSEQEQRVGEQAAGTVALAEDGLELDGGEGGVTGGVHVDAVESERGLGRSVELLGGGEEVDERHAIGLGDGGHGGSVEREVLVVAGGELGVEVGGLQVLMRDRGEQDDADLALAVVGREGLLEPAVEVGLEGVEASRAGEGLVEAPVSEDHVGVEVRAGVVGDLGLADPRGQGAGLHVEEVIEAGHFVGAMGLHADFVAGEAEVSNHDIVLRERLMDQGLEVAVVLLPVGEAAADEGDVVTLLEGEVLGRDGGESEQGQQEGGQLAHGVSGFDKKREGHAVKHGRVGEMKTCRSFNNLPRGMFLTGPANEPQSRSIAGPEGQGSRECRVWSNEYRGIDGL